MIEFTAGMITAFILMFLDWRRRKYKKVSINDADISISIAKGENGQYQASIKDSNQGLAWAQGTTIPELFEALGKVSVIRNKIKEK